MENNNSVNFAEYDFIPNLLAQIEKVIVGKRDVVKMLVAALLSGGHVLIEDVPGTGKTTLAMTLAKATSLSCRRVQFTPDVMASDITGFTMYNKESERFEYRNGLVMSNIFIADEINRTSPKTQSALLEAMEEKKVTVDGDAHKLPEPFMVIATENEFGYVGTYPLPEAQLDRFLMRLSMGYPDRDSQVALMKERHHSNPLDQLTAVVDIPGLQKLIADTAEVYVSDEIYGYISDLAEESRHQEYIQLGVSPRGALAVCRTAKANAFLKGRDYVLPEDVKEIFSAVCAHRLVLSAKARLHEYMADDLLTDILKGVKEPSVKEFSIR